MLALGGSAQAGEQPRPVFIYCEGSPPATVRSSIAYVSDVFAHTLSADGRSIDRVTQEFRDQAEWARQPIGATCHHSATRRAAMADRDAFIRHRRTNGYAIERLP